MKIRLPCLTPAANAQPNAAETESVTRAPTVRPTSVANLITLAGARANRAPGPTSFSSPTQASALVPAIGSSRTSSKLSKAQLNAAVDRWAQTQEIKYGLYACKQIKEVLHLSTPKKFSFKRESGPSELRLRSSNLTSIPKELGQASNLKKLLVSYNRLTSVPAQLGQAKALEQLDLANNLLTDLPAEIAQLPKLKHLSLNTNRFTHVPRALLDLPSDTEVDLRNNPIPDEELLAVRAAIQTRRDAGRTMPMLILPAVAADA